jgi:poly(A) polymerase
MGSKKYTPLVEALMGDTVAISDLIDSGWMAENIPEFLDLKLDSTGAGKHKDNLAHTIQVVIQCPQVESVRLCAFFHDIGKPPTRKIDGKLVTFHGHEQVGASMTSKIMERLGFDRSYAKTVSRMVYLSGRTKGCNDWSDAAVRRFIKECGSQQFRNDLLDFIENDCTSKDPRNHRNIRVMIRTLRERIEKLLAQEQESKKRPPLTGKDVMARYGFSPGPIIGKLMRGLTSEMGEEEAWAKVEGNLSEAVKEMNAP